jgi:hypothetical protein
MIIGSLQAQNGNITIHDEAGAGDLIEKHIMFNKDHGELPGYRIQIFAGTSLTNAKEAKSSFLKVFDIPAVIIFEAPNYKVRVGNYTNRFEANSDLQTLTIDYPDALIVKDLITVNH